MNLSLLFNLQLFLGVKIQTKTVVPENTRLIATKPDDGFSDDEADESAKTDAQNAYGPSAFAYVSDEEEDLDSDASVDGPVKANDPWGCALQV